MDAVKVKRAVASRVGCCRPGLMVIAVALLTGVIARPVAMASLPFVETFETRTDGALALACGVYVWSAAWFWICRSSFRSGVAADGNTNGFVGI